MTQRFNRGWLHRFCHRLGFYAIHLYRAYAIEGVADRAACLAYFFLFSLFPFLVFLTTLLAYVPDVGPVVFAMFERARPWLPSAAMGVIDEQLQTVVATTQPRLLTVGLGAAIFSASRGVSALSRALNAAMLAAETRAWWLVEILVILATLAGGVLVLAMAIALLLGSQIVHWLSERVPQWAGAAHGDRLQAQWLEHLQVWEWMRWPVTGIVMFLLAALSYRWLPARRASTATIVPGALLTTLTWLIVTYVFTFYVDVFANYNVMYGSLGGVIVLMVWAYLTALIYLLGATFNALRVRP